MSLKKRVLVWFFWSLGLTNLLRAGIGWYLLPLLSDIPHTLPLWLWFGSYGAWGIGFIIAAYRHPPYPKPLYLMMLYQAWCWGVNLLFVRSGYARALWGRDALLSLISVGVVWWLARPARH